jgi:hypothetical protein
MENITLPTNLVNAILQYLASRPYGDVVQLISEIQKEAASQAVKEQQPE